MAHLIPVENGRAMMMYVDEVPWHGLGQKLNGPATSEKAIAAAGLDWSVRKRPLYADGGFMKPQIEVKSHVCLVREDKEQKGEDSFLSVVGRNYNVLQNHEAFMFFDQIVGMGRAVYETAGAILDGQVIWILARIPSDLVTANGEKIHPYILLSNGHGMGRPVSLKLTAVRVVCNNTLSFAMDHEAGKIIRIAHTASMRGRLADARGLLGLIDRTTLELRRFAERLRSLQLNDQQHDDYLRNVFPEPNPSAKGNLVNRQRDTARWYRAEAKGLAQTGRGNTTAEVRGTLWAAYNGVTDVLDHAKPVAWSDDRMLASVWFGQRDTIKRRATKLAEELAAEAN